VISEYLVPAILKLLEGAQIRVLSVLSPIFTCWIKAASIGFLLASIHAVTDNVEYTQKSLGSISIFQQFLSLVKTSHFLSWPIPSFGDIIEPSCLLIDPGFQNVDHQHTF